MGYMIGGYTVFVPRSWTTPIDMTVEEAMRSALIAFMSSKRHDKNGVPTRAADTHPDSAQP
jgi:uncharacterized membrane protein